ncbi:uncharacterized protein LOC115626131 isoform X2 [Scaptodrosophila lebanonensis]|uniref:Uncharacterized protein LOC115626131 isoform X2 n=1 Tax=Drosophila lebanonensis TaxID=7225 RepID=A0A6J2TNZ8_DROLE|nr:uncharacterized protein LOC115626131 isoform X2 [Scaptodrosophila lebanonensis]
MIQNHSNIDVPLCGHKRKKLPRVHTHTDEFYCKVEYNTTYWCLFSFMHTYPIISPNISPGIAAQETIQSLYYTRREHLNFPSFISQPLVYFMLPHQIRPGWSKSPEYNEIETQINLTKLHELH